MVKFSKKVLFTLLIIFVLLAVVAPIAQAQFGLQDTATKAGLRNEASEGKGPTALAGEIIGYGLSFIGVVFFVLMIYGGLRWMTARGNSEITERAKNIIEAAFIGIIIVFLAYTVTNFVINRLIQTTQPTATGE